MTEDDGVAIVIIPCGARRGFQRHALRIARHVRLHELHAVDRLQRGRQRRLQRTAEREARGVADQMIERDGPPGIIGALPCCDRHRLVQLQRALAHQDAGERRDHRFGGGEAEQWRIDADAVGIALGDDAAVLHHHDRAGVARCRFVRFRKGAVDGRFK